MFIKLTMTSTRETFSVNYKNIMLVQPIPGNKAFLELNSGEIVHVDESSGYILSRIDEILNDLTGGSKSAEIFETIKKELYINFIKEYNRSLTDAAPVFLSVCDLAYEKAELAASFYRQKKKDQMDK